MPSAPDAVRVLVVDDEEPARQRLVDLLSHDRDVSDITEADNGLVAVEAITRAQPDLVFLDVTAWTCPASSSGRAPCRSWSTSTPTPATR
jgi:CheY-like chemotaxis protein